MVDKWPQPSQATADCLCEVVNSQAYVLVSSPYSPMLNWKSEPALSDRARKRVARDAGQDAAAEAAAAAAAEGLV